jgi:RHS repeat-associated protein
MFHGSQPNFDLKVQIAMMSARTLELLCIIPLKCRISFAELRLGLSHRLLLRFRKIRAPSRALKRQRRHIGVFDRFRCHYKPILCASIAPTRHRPFTPALARAPADKPANFPRLTSISDGTGVTRFGYDHRGNLTARQPLLGTSATASLAYSHDLADRIATIAYPSGRQVRYVRDGKGRVSAIDSRATATAAWVSLASGVTYQPFGALSGMTQGNGLAVANDRGLDGRLKNRRLTRSATGVRLSDLSYVYDPDGNITSIDDAVTPALSALYGYDPVGRLNMMVADPGSGSGAGGSATTASYSYTAGSNRLASLTTPAGLRSITYDARGNPASETRPASQSVTLAYDGHARLTSYARTGEVSLAHGYNGLDDRVSTITTPNGGTADTRRFVYAPDGRVLGEYGASASDVKAEFIWLNPQVGDAGTFGGDDGLGGYMPLAVVTTGGTLTWVHANHMGVPALYTNSTGTAITAPTGYTAPGFPGQSRTLADLYYNRYRDYDPTTGRYIQADPIGLAGGASPYSYAMNNPLRYTDPTGEFVPAAIACAANPVCRTLVSTGVTLLIYYGTGLNEDPCDQLLYRRNSGRGYGGGGSFGNPPRSRGDDDDDDYCGRRFAYESQICRADYGEVWGYDHFSYQGCIERAKIREDMCRRGLEGPPRWSDRDVSGEPWTPKRKKR